MPRACTICLHPNRNAIEAELDRGKPFRNVAEQYQVSASSLFRHKKHITITPQPEAIAAVSNNGGRVERLTEQTENLTGKQQMFVDALLGDARFNATEAARMAGYDASEPTLRSIASENLRKPNIQRAIQERLKLVHMSADEALAELASIARSDPEKFLQLKIGKDGEVVYATLPLRDKLKALELIAKHQGLLPDRLRTENLSLNVHVHAEFSDFLSRLEAIDAGEPRLIGAGSAIPQNPSPG